MEYEGEGVDKQGDDDQATDSGNNMTCEFNLQRSALFEWGSCELAYLGHLDLAKLVPQILNGVQADERSDQESNPFNTAHEADAHTGQDEPSEPLRAETLLLQRVELGPAQHGREGEAQQHRIQEDESADGGVGILAEHHERDEPHGSASEVERLGGIVGQGDRDSSKESIECPHHDVVQVLRVLLPGLEFEGSIVACEVSGQSNQHLSERRVHIEVEFAFEVVRTEFPETVILLIPLYCTSEVGLEAKGGLTELHPRSRLATGQSCIVE